jgi:formylglycine-generating enzyme required for sulfatase activity
LHSFDFVTVILDKEGKLKNRETKTANAYTEDLGGGVKLEMVAIPPGEFILGSPETEANRSSNEGPQHRVRIGYWFYLGKFEVTQAQWRAVMGTNPSFFNDCDDCPAENVSWDDATEFCRKLSARTGREYRLPSEAEWEYAARAGTTTPFAFGDTITPEIVNYDGRGPYASAAKGSYRYKTVAVGSLGVANAFGLYDMHGNVWEWCQDWFHWSYSAIAGDAPADGRAWLSGGTESAGKKDPVSRGGSWGAEAKYSRSASRSRGYQGFRGEALGFRIAVTVWKRQTNSSTDTSTSSGPSTGVYVGTIPNYGDSSDGLILDGVRPDSPAAKAGLRAGDKIVRLAGQDVRNVQDFKSALDKMKAGQEYEVEVVRGSQRLTLKVTPTVR